MMSIRFFGLIIENLSYVFSDETVRRLCRLVPHKNLQELLEISDTMRRRSQEIIDERKTALAGGDEALMAQVGEGKDIMSICRK